MISLKIDENLFVLTEDGQNVLYKDCLKYRISRQKREIVFNNLLTAIKLFEEGVSLRTFQDRGILKKLVYQPKTRLYDVWEIRDEGLGTRLIFIWEKPNTIIVSAVTKRMGSLTQAINRGVNRWKKYLRKEKSQFPNY